MTYEQTNEVLRTQQIIAGRHDEAVAKKLSQDKMALLETLEDMVRLFAPSQTVDQTVDGETALTLGGKTIDKARAVIEQTKKQAA